MNEELKNFEIEFKANQDERGVIEGYASTFGNVDRHGDIITKGAFVGGRTKVPIFGMHDPNKAIGVGFVTEDEKGLQIRIKLAVDNQDSDILRERAREYYAMAKEGIIEKMSIGFATLEQDFEQRKIAGKNQTIRLIKKVDLMEVSLVPIPANDKARVVQVKSVEGDDLAEMIREAVREELKSLTQEEKHHEDDNQDTHEQKNEEQKSEKSTSIDSLIMKKMGLF